MRSGVWEIFVGKCSAWGVPEFTARQARRLDNQEAAAADARAAFSLDVAAASLEGSGCRWQLELAPGPRQTLASGQWDATGQLLANGTALEATAARLPYLSGFAG